MAAFQANRTSLAVAAIALILFVLAFLHSADQLPTNLSFKTSYAFYKDN